MLPDCLPTPADQTRRPRWGDLRPARSG